MDKIEFRREIHKRIPQSFNTKGIYTISINNYIVYVGESVNVADRVLQHSWQILIATPKDGKYWHLRRARDKGYKVTISLAEDCRNCSEAERMQKEIEWIKFFNPPLNVMHTRGMHLQEFYENII